MTDKNDYTTSELENSQEAESECFDYDSISSSDDDARLLENYRYARCRQRAAAPDVEKAWRHFKDMVIDRQAEHRAARRSRIMMYVAVAAAVVVIAMVPLALWLMKDAGGDGNAETAQSRYPEYTVSDNGNIIAFEADDAPQVTMIGTDGKNMMFISKSKDGGIVVDYDKAVCCKMSPAQIVNIANKTIATPRGKQFEVVFSDGSKAILNADSRLSFPVCFVDSCREVELCGEAYFEVVKDPSRPFVVKTPKITTTVLGTEFNVRAYNDQPYEVILVDGSVEVRTNAAPDENVVLSPGQNVFLSSGNTLDVYTADIENGISWKSGLFHYDDVKLLTVVKDMGRWYNVDVVITDSSVKYCPLTFELPRTGSLAEFIEKLNATGFLSVSVSGQKVVIDRCKGGQLPMAKIL